MLVIAAAVLFLLGATATWVAFAVHLGDETWGRQLKDVPPVIPGGGDWPSLSVVIACRNEGDTVAAAMTSVLAQDYPSLEVIAVDDRSTDATGSILDGLSRADPRLRTMHITSLPAGWLGKNHALAQGAAADLARGTWLLFTDADVRFGPQALRRAIAWVTTARLGHAVALPRFDAPGFLERSFVSLFALFLLGRLRLSELRRPRSHAYVGAGGFNLVRADEYRRVGGHARLRMEVADDLKLGLILRRSGVRQGCLLAGDQVHVRWQNGFVASLRGLHKNFFAGVEFGWWRAVGISAGVPLITCGPAVLSAASPALHLPMPLGIWAVAVWVGSSVLHGLTARRVAGGSGAEGVALPISGLGVAYVSLASALLTTVRGGIVWRDTRYSLGELRAGCVRDADWPTTNAVD